MTTTLLKSSGGFIEKSVKTLDEINEYANMPGREELLSMLASALQDPMRKIARAVKRYCRQGRRSRIIAVYQYNIKLKLIT